MNTNVFRRVLFTLIGMAVASTASAGTITTWLGSGTNNNWTTSNNWSTTPTTSGTWSLIYGGTPTRTTSANNVGAVKVDSIQFVNDGSAGKTSRFTLSNTANTLSLTAGGSVTSTAVSGTTLQDTISTNLSLLGTGTFNLGSSHNLLVSGTLNTAGTLVKTGAGSLFVQGATTLSGLQIDQGTVQLSGSAASAVNGLVVEVGSSGNTGTLLLNGAASTSTASFKVRGNAIVAPTNFSNVTFTSSTFNVADATITSPVTLSLGGGAVGNLGTQTVQGVIQDNSGTGTVGVKIGASSSDTNVWVLQGNNTYTGATTVSASAKLLMDGTISASSTTTSSGYLGGSGTFGGAVSVISGTLSPGGTSTSGGIITDTIGTLTVGSLSLSSPAVTAMTVTGSTAGLYDQIAVSTSMSYGGTLSLTLSGSYVDYTTFDLFSGFTSQSGSFAGITLDATGSPYAGLVFSGTADANGDWYTGWTTDNQQLKFSQSTGRLTVVPEPSTIVFAGIGMAMFGWSTWTRRRAKARRQVIEAAVA